MKELKKAAPLIGVTPLFDSEKQRQWMLPDYLEAIEDAGGIPLVLPLTWEPRTLQSLCARCDGLLFSGGQDVSPAIYGQQPLFDNVIPCPERDAMETELLRLALREGKPLLCICRGLQLLNACLGGTLWQDLPTQLPSGLDHRQELDYCSPSHSVRLIEGSPLCQRLGVETVSVNSLHHQGIRALAPGLKPMAEADDGLCEAVCLPEKRFVWAVQWHPEYLLARGEASRSIFTAFIEAASEAYGEA